MVVLTTYSGVLGAVKRTLLGQPALSSVCTHSLAIRLFHKTSISPNNCARFWPYPGADVTEASAGQLLIDELFDIVHRPAVTAIPCRTIGSRGLEVEWDFVLCIIAT